MHDLIIAFVGLTVIVSIFIAMFRMALATVFQPNIKLGLAFYYVAGLYLVMIALFASFDLVISHLENNQFNVLLEVRDGSLRALLGTIIKCLYFSIATISTVGFGDIYPTASLSRCVVILEIFSGVFFNALFFAILAAHLANKIAERATATERREPSQDS
jgi:hypothetical protein